MEGTEIIDSLDIFAEVGKNTAHDHAEVVNVTDGDLNITFRTDPLYGRGSPQVNAILIEPAY